MISGCFWQVKVTWIASEPQQRPPLMHQRHCVLIPYNHKDTFDVDGNK